MTIWKTIFGLGFVCHSDRLVRPRYTPETLGQRRQRQRRHGGRRRMDRNRGGGRRRRIRLGGRSCGARSSRVSSRSRSHRRRRPLLVGGARNAHDAHQVEQRRLDRVQLLEAEGSDVCPDGPVNHGGGQEHKTRMTR